jgi:hypothetical protein
VSVSVWVVHETALKHLVVGWFDTWNHVGGRESYLFRLSVEVLGVLVKNELANLLERVVAVWPDLRDVIDVEAVVFSVSDGHDLSKPSPGWEVTFLDVVEKIHGGVVLLALAHLGGLITSEVSEKVSINVVTNLYFF